MQVEEEAIKRRIPPSGVQSALFFESPAEIFGRVLAQIHHGAAHLSIDFAFRPFANANSRIRLMAGGLRVHVSDVLETAPAPVLESLAFILISRLFRRRVPSLHSDRYRGWMNRLDVSGHVHRLRRDRGRKLVDAPSGEFYCLQQVFDTVNRRFFDGNLPCPLLGWSRKRSHTRLGHHDPSHNAIVLSRIFDGPDIPSYVVEYVMYHEMLHIVHPSEHTGRRRVVHTKAFREAERRFPEFVQARAALKRLLTVASYAAKR